ncbi:MAG: hypothetical protein ACOWWH_06510 [Eubacteriaceae bacterium]
MSKINQFKKLLTNDVLLNLLNKDKIKIAELNSITCLLINCNIPFEITFDEASRSSAAAITITIILSPSTYITHIIDLESGVVDGGI